MTTVSAVHIRPIDSEQFASASRWDPVPGTSFKRYCSHLGLDPASSRALTEASISILSKCTPPGHINEVDTGLVVGYVQSGKTRSFTAVSALARDNGYRLVILITGISTILLDQSTTRLRKDLEVDRDPVGGWTVLVNPKADAESLSAIRMAVDDWADTTLPLSDRKTVFISVMKNHQHLKNLCELLENASRVLRLVETPTLIIDDEADQASLNTKHKSNSMSTTYARILELRSLLPTHTYLQYTATPQAPLLLNVLDRLSPSFVHVLEPAPGYTGGDYFFGPGSEPFRIRIPESDLEALETLDSPPPSLRTAFATFVVGLAAQWLLSGQNVSTRSMLVHPSNRRDSQQAHFSWICSIREQWMRLAASDASEDREDLEKEVRDTLSILAGTIPNLPTVDEIIDRLPATLRKINVQLVNAASGKTPTVDWPRSLGHVLVGGQAMDRGFTVEGLTVTYMPRPIGQGNADSIQQRGRFFGYKQSYAGWCRLFLAEEVERAFQEYVAHESSIRNELRKLQGVRDALRLWRRAFILESLRPTRSNVISINYRHLKKLTDWNVLSPQVFPAYQRTLLSQNESVLRAFLQGLELNELSDYSGDTEAQIHKGTSVPLQLLLDDLLLPWRVGIGEKADHLSALTFLLRDYLDSEPSADALLVLMGGSPRERSLDTSGSIRNLFQGENPARPGLKGYIGDRNVKSNNRVTVQIHQVALLLDNVRILETPVLAVFVPRAIKTGVLLQVD